MVLSRALLTLGSLTTLALGQTEPNWGKEGDVWYDKVQYGPAIELIHRYNDEFPTGIAVSREGRKFSNYPPGLDGNNTNNGRNNKYTIAELHPNNTETPWPSAQLNNPPGGAINYTTFPPTGANYPNYIIGSQSIIIDSENYAWILDTGRSLTPDGTLVLAAYGGPKLLKVSLANNSIIQTILFPPSVAYPDSYLNDVRISYNKRNNSTTATTGAGYAYITDSSVEGRNGIIIADLATGKSWRHLDGSARVHPQDQNVGFLWGVPLYVAQPGEPNTYVNFGSDGIALSKDGATLYWKVVGGRYLYSVPTARLIDTSINSDILAQHAISVLGQSGISDGLETDTNGFIYHGNMEQNAIGLYNPVNGTDSIFVRDARLNWIDTMSVGFDGYLYFTNNQLVLGSGLAPGTDRRRRPFTLWRVKLPGNGTKVI